MKLIIRESKKPINIDNKFFLMLLPQSIMDNLLAMNNSKLDIEKWNKRNFIIAIVLLIFFIVASFSFQPLIFLGLFVSGSFYYKQLQSVNSAYQQFRFERQLQFTKFVLLTVPILQEHKNSESGIDLRNIFKGVVPRLQYEVDRKILESLRADMLLNPASYEPFRTFADKMSGSDNSHLIMSTLADLTQGSIDLSVIDRLARLANKEMMEGMDQIILTKVNSFNGLFMRLAISLAFIVIGFTVATIVYQAKGLSISV